MKTEVHYIIFNMSIMKRIFMVFIVTILSNSFSFGQQKAEKLIDSVLVCHISKTYQQYTDCIKQKEKELTPSASEMEAIYKKNGIYPSFSTMYYSKECPLIIVRKQNQLLGKVIYPSFNTNFKKILKVLFYPPKSDDSLLYGTQGQYGVYIIEVE